MVDSDCHQQVLVGPVACMLGTVDAVVMNQDAGFRTEEVVIPEQLGREAPCTGGAGLRAR